MSILRTSIGRPRSVAVIDRHRPFLHSKATTMLIRIDRLHGEFIGEDASVASR